jgi:curli biogenesis system outer membrane secretion channel CsgG
LAAAGQTKRIAIYDFDYKAVRSDVFRIYGSDKNVGAIASQRILSKLVGKGNFLVIDRNQIDKLLKEQNQKFSDRFDPADAPKLGKLLNVDAIVTGSVDAIADKVENNRVGVGPVGLGKVEAVAEATVSMRVISTQTAQIFIADQINKREKQTLAKGAKVGKSGGGDGGSVSAHPEALAVSSAIQLAADTLAAEMLDKADALPTRTGGGSPVKSSSDSTASGASSAAGATGLIVGKVVGNKVYLTGGENAGVKVNDQFDVRHVTGTMKGPSGNDIEMDEKVDTLVVTDVQDQFSVARSTAGTPLAKEGDRLKKAKAAAAPAPKKAPAPAAGVSGLPAPVQRKQ